MKATIDCTDDQLKINITPYNFSFPLKWIVFGSSLSTDIDVAVYIPPCYITRIKGFETLLCSHLDNELSKVFSHLSSKPINTCLAFWCDGKIIWCQKGSIAESNNSYISTFNNHTYLQYYSSCPLNIILPRNIPEKVCSATRMIITALGSASYCQDNEAQKLFFVLLQSPEIHYITNIDLFVSLQIGRFTELNFPHKFKSLVDSTTMQSIRNFRVKRNKLVSDIIANIKTKNYLDLDEKLDAIWRIHDEVSMVLDGIVKSIKSINNIDPHIIKTLDKNMMDGKFQLNRITAATLKSGLLAIQIRLLTLIDWKLVDIGRDAASKYKTIAFQLAQTSALLDGTQLFDKDDMCKVYGQLEPFLSRKNITDIDLNNLTAFTHNYANKILQLMANKKHQLNVNIEELKIKQQSMVEVMNNVNAYITQIASN